ncbi:hypothetical protein K7432_002301 [Basidiobolus ranarum]|uniref:chitin synthase n=1 Tax=Basidiobolus ranarum TaxID=34480 RepID=A0ABR2X1P9_9FUNG
MSQYLHNAENGGYLPEDVTHLDLKNLTEDSFTHCIQGRFEQAQLYTKINNSALIAVNSFGPEKENTAISQQYIEACYRDTSGNPHNLPSHIYELAAKVYLHLRRTGVDQSIILSGVTGSGKSESYKKLLSQFCNLAAYGKKETKLPGQIQNIQVVLEAFGNAMTTQNQNASRYCMYQEIQYNARGRISGAKTLTFSLEKYRVTHTPLHERNFNSFYYLLAGLSADEKSALELSEPEDYHYLSQTQRFKIDGVDDGDKFRELRAAMKSLGIKTSVQTNVFRLLTGILHLGNIIFEDHSEQECSNVKNTELLQLVAEIFGVGYTPLMESLIFKSKLVGKDVCTVYLDAKTAGKQRDALARALYSLLFTWIVEAINTKVCNESPTNFIGLLDPIGFQNMEHNRYEEFCINFTNEKIHNFILKHMFDPSIGMNSELAADGVTIPNILYSDNQSCVDMIIGKASLIEVIEENGISESEEDSKNISLIIDQRFGKHSSFHSTQTHNQFGIKHYAGTVDYDTDNFVEKNKDILAADFVSLFRGSTPSTNAFVTELFSSDAVETESHPRSKDTIIAAQQLTKPTRQSSRRHPKKPDVKKESSKSSIPGVLTQLDSTLNDLFDTMNETLIWNVFNIRSNLSQSPYEFDAHCVRNQIVGLSLTEIACRLVNDYTASLEFSEFLERYQPIIEALRLDSSKDSRQLVMAVKNISGWNDKDMYVGAQERVFLCEHVWKELEDSLRAMEKDERNAQKGRASSLGHDGESLVSGYNGHDNTSMPPRSMPYDTGSYNSEEDYRSQNMPSGYGQYAREDSEYGSEFDFRNQPGNEIELTKASKGDSKGAPVVETLPLSAVRRSWLCVTKLFTWWIPSFTLSWCGMKRPDVQLAWREKVTLCIFILILWGVIIFIIVGLGLILCPRVHYYNATDVAFHQGKGDLFVYMYGKVYDVSIFADSDHGRTSVSTGVPYSEMSSMIVEVNNDITPYFEIPLHVQCPGLVAEGSTLQMKSDIVLPITVPHQTGIFQTNPNSPMKNDNWFYTNALPFLRLSTKGDVAWEVDHIRYMSQQGYKKWGIINGRVYDLTSYFNTIDDPMNVNVQQFLDPQIKQLFHLSSTFGPDLTKEWNEKVHLDSQTRAMNMECLDNLFYIGVVDTRHGIKCKLAHWIPVAFAIVLCSVIGLKFLAALQLTSKRKPEDLDKFVICQVPCYTEDEDSLRKTIDSLAGLQYDDKRKLIFFIADGMIIGSGNDRPTPKIVCDILGVDPDYDPEPFSFKSIGEGNQQHNMAKVYSGLYEFEGHVVPYIVVAKIGKPSERSRPGNRGKRDSQIILMNFLNRVHFDSEMCPLDLEIYHQIKNVIGVNPAFYEYILMVDADTEVKPDSLTRLIACMTHDARIIGLCGETQLANEEFSWATMIQVYEYYISHHLAKAFESLFGSVTCLPGCFCMYRIRTVKGSPLIINNEVINNYSENNVDTLHKKNLLSLGEDRYLTTLMLKHFPQYKMKFTSDAICYTVAPDKWSVLLSQRRRWINSTVHNLFELLFLSDLCGFCCFSMRFVVFLDLFGTIIMPATVAYLVYLIIAAIIDPNSLSTVALIMFAVVYGLQAVIFILKREWQHVGWMIIYILAMPIFSFAIPIYAFWHFDDFSWGNTRMILGDKGEKKVVSNEAPFDPKSIPMKKWSQFEQEAWEAGSTTSKDHSSRSRSRSRFEGSQYDGSQYRSQSPYAGSQYGGSQVSANYYDKQSSYYQGHDQRPASHLSPSVMPSPGFNGSNHDGYIDSRTSLAYSQYGHDMSPDRHSVAPQSPYDYPVHQMPMAMPSPRPESAMSGGGYYPTDEEILGEIRHILSTADLMTVTKKQVREQLALVFGADMSPRRDFINNSIELVLQGQI